MDDDDNTLNDGEHPWGNMTPPAEEASTTPAEGEAGSGEPPAEGNQEQPGQEGTETPGDGASADGAGTEEPKPEPKKPSQLDRRFAVLTAKGAADRQALAEAQRKLAAAEALLAAAGKQPAPTVDASGQPIPAPTPTAQSVVSDQDVETRARQLNEQREFTSRLSSLIMSGKQAYTPEGWQERTAVLAETGILNNQTFMQTLIHLPNGPAVVAALSEDVDSIVELANKSPVAMATQLGIMSEKLNKPAAPAAKPISKAPTPGTPVKAAREVANPTVYDTDKLDMAAWVRKREAEAPRRLGGRPKAK